MVKKYKSLTDLNNVMSRLESVMTSIHMCGENVDESLVKVLNKEWDKLYEYKKLGKGKNLPEYSIDE